VTGTSRNTVREAVQSLVHAGLLERRQGSGTYVRGDSELAGAVGRRVADADQRDVLEVRRVLEVGVARLAARRRRPEDVDRLFSLIEHRNAAGVEGDVEEVAIRDGALHAAIADTTHNAVLCDLYASLTVTLQENIRHNMGASFTFDPAEHVELVKAIDQGDEDRAAIEAACYLDALLESERDVNRRR
jgi:DNA-binding FadR family transcriptional regulator